VKGLVAHPEDLPRVVLVIGDAAVAQSALGHDGVQATVRDGQAAAAAGRLASSDERVDGGVATVFLLDLAVASASHVEEATAHDARYSNDSHHHAGGNARCIWS